VNTGVDTGGSDIVDTGGSDDIVGIVVAGIVVVSVPPVVGIIVEGVSVPPSSMGMQLVQHSGISHPILQSTTRVSSGLGRKSHISVGMDPVK